MKEQSFCRVGDSKINVGHGLSKEVREKYADGGITDGTEVGWKKPAVPVELRGLVGPPGLFPFLSISTIINKKLKKKKKLMLLLRPMV